MIQEIYSEELKIVMLDSQKAFKVYRECSAKKRAALLHSIASELQKESDDLIQTAMEETNLTAARLRSELSRTCYQLTSYADVCETYSWMDLRIETPNNAVQPLRPDLRKMMVPLGPVLVFGASNFPFAYSTAGGDTASALAAGCTVVVKAHPAHPQTSLKAAACIQKALRIEGLNPAIFQHVTGSSAELARQLVQDPHTSAVGFTGSYIGGKQMFDWAAQRKDPIPVFAEMGSTNPVFLLPNALKEKAASIAHLIGDSVLQSSGQFCTKPGLLIGIDSPELDQFIEILKESFQQAAPSRLLHPGIQAQYQHSIEMLLGAKGVKIISWNTNTDEQVMPLLAETKVMSWLKSDSLQQEVFGPFTLLIRCSEREELLELARHLEGQLTATIHAAASDADVIEVLQKILSAVAGRIIFNGVPTGVSVSWAMQHGGPFPATTDSRFTGVGPDAIRRFARPVCYQNCPNQWLPEALKNENPLNLLRMVNGELTRNTV